MAKKVTEEQKIDTVVGAMLLCPSIQAVTNKTGYSKATVYRIMNKPEFQSKMGEARRKSLDTAINYLQSSVGDCTEVLVKIAKNEKASPGTRVNAAQAVIAQAGKWLEYYEMLNRIGKLEEMVEALQGE